MQWTVILEQKLDFLLKNGFEMYFPVRLRMTVDEMSGQDAGRKPESSYVV